MITHLPETLLVTQSTLDSALNDHPDFCSFLNSVGTQLRMKYEELGDVEDLQMSISIHRQALHICAKGHPNRLYFLRELSVCLTHRFHRFGSREDLDEALKCCREWFSSPDLATVHFCAQQLAELLRIRSEYCCSVEDLEEADLILESVASLKHDAASMHGDESDIGFLRYNLQRRTSGPRDIEAVIYALRQKVAEPSSDCWIYQCWLSLALRDLYARLGLLEDIDEAVTLSRASAVVCPPKHPARPLLLRSSASIFLTRFRALREGEDAWTVLQLYRNALSLLPPGNVERHRCLAEIARLFLEEGTPYYDIRSAIYYTYQIAEDSHGSAGRRLNDIVRLLDLIKRSPSFLPAEDNGIVQLYVAAVRLSANVAFRESHPDGQLVSLRSADTLSLDAATLSLEASRPDAAIHLLELGRASFWASIYGRGNNEGKDLLQPGRFLSIAKSLVPTEYADLSAASEGGPVILLVENATTCSAIIIRSPSDEPRRLVLGSACPKDLEAIESSWSHSVRGARTEMQVNAETFKGLSPADPRELATPARGNEDEFSQVLETLWLKVVRPITAALGLGVSPISLTIWHHICSQNL
jgi:hypothetical protein